VLVVVVVRPARNRLIDRLYKVHPEGKRIGVKRS
jgi:hypothetical protein